MKRKLGLACSLLVILAVTAVWAIPGPKIIVRKVAGDVLEWSVDPGSGPVVQSTGASAWTSGKIRSDFVGTEILDLAVHATSGSSYTNVSYVIFQTQSGGNTYTVEAIRTVNDKIRWYVTKGANRKLLTPDSTLSTSEVPMEFTAPLILSPWTFREEQEDVDIDEVNFLRVEL